MIPYGQNPAQGPITQSTLAVTGASRLRSEEAIPRMMPRILTSWDMTATFIVSIYLATCATTAASEGPAAFSYILLACIAFFIPCIIATAQLGSMFPHEGAIYNWTYQVLGKSWSFFAGFCAWLPGVLISTSLADLLITYTRALQMPWLTTPWQQGIAISMVLFVGGIISTQRLRHVQNLINILVCLTFVSASLIGLSAVIWILTRHGIAVHFNDWSSWQLKPENFVMFGLLIFAYIGADGPMKMAGEIVDKRVIKRHLLWGGVAMMIIYLTNTFAVLTVLGTQAANNPLAMVTVVDMTLGKVAGIICTICLMCSFFATVLVYNYMYARLLLVGSVDRRLPKAIGKLNKQHVPANAILFQMAMAIIFTVLTFIVAPAVVFTDNPMNFASQVYNISLASAALMWTISAALLFICLVGCYLRDPKRFYQQRICAMPIIWLSVISGSISCLVTIIDTLIYTWTPLIPNKHWWYLVGSLTLIFLIASGIMSIMARSEAEWQTIYDSITNSQSGEPPLR